MKFSKHIVLLFTFLMIGAAAAAQTGEKKYTNKAAETSEEIRPLLVGDVIPDKTVKSTDGKKISLRSLVSQQPTVLIFYRGGWCPYCNTQLAELQRIVPNLRKTGYQLIAVSADKPSRLNKSVQKHDLDYQLYSDNTMETAQAFGIAYTVDPKTIKRYKENGLDLAGAAGHEHGILPVPSVFLVDTDGMIRFKYINPNYKVRLKSSVLLEAAKAYYPEEN